MALNVWALTVLLLWITSQAHGQKYQGTGYSSGLNQKYYFDPNTYKAPTYQKSFIVGGSPSSSGPANVPSARDNDPLPMDNANDAMRPRDSPSTRTPAPTPAPTTTTTKAPIPARRDPTPAPTPTPYPQKESPREQNPTPVPVPQKESPREPNPPPATPYPARDRPNARQPRRRNRYDFMSSMFGPRSSYQRTPPRRQEPERPVVTPRPLFPDDSPFYDAPTPAPAYVVPPTPTPTYATPPKPTYVAPPKPTYVAPPKPTYVAPPKPTYAPSPRPSYVAPSPRPAPSAQPSPRPQYQPFSYFPSSRQPYDFGYQRPTMFKFGDAYMPYMKKAQARKKSTYKRPISHGYAPPIPKN